MTLELIPAIDLLDGNVVRLTKGVYDTATVYSRDPVQAVRAFCDAGASMVHVVDLDGAREGTPGNIAVIERVLAATTVGVQVGGGIRTRETAERWLGAGASRVVLGTTAIANPELAAALCADHPDRVVVALDAHGDRIATEGWQKTTDVSVLDIAPRVEQWGAAAILFTNITRDGTREGPDIPGTVRVQQSVQIPVIASGGIGALAHVAALRDAGIRVAVCGRALYSGAFELVDGLAVARGEREPT